ncbi:MAG: PolC-type DNA polymerase III [Oscillospiraceae bacterium]|jgi:DNA polymerase-3 subunit alpha (Gram-positive type)|nr:PolC-type DNA polymerase III [Oscillospiraceae bacterium]
MTWQSLFPDALSELVPHLTLEKVLIDRAATKLLVCFLSDILVEEKAYLAIKAALRKDFPGLAVSLRVRSPALADAVRADMTPFIPFLIDCLARSSPGVRPWLADARWSLEGDHLCLAVSSEAALRYVRHTDLDKRLTALMWDVFTMKVDTALISEEDMQAQRERLQAIETAAAQEALRIQAEETAKAAKQKPQKDERKIMGQPIREALTEIGDLREDSGKVAVRGEIITAETKELKGGEMRLLSFSLTDYTGTIACKAFLRYRHRKLGAEGAAQQPYTPEEIARVDAITSRIQAGAWLTVRGDCQYDKYAHETVIMLTDIEAADAPKHEDNAPEKRVELHLHTQMSNMDAVSSATALIAQAAAWGHPAIAITDHGVVQAFPEAFAAAKKHKIKLIPGMEGYLLTDETNIVEGADARGLDSPIVVLDFETTGLSPKHDRVIEIGAVRMRGDAIEEELSLMVDPGVSLPAKITEITGITSAMLRGAPAFGAVAQQLLDFIGDMPIAAHNAPFDVGFLRAELARMGLSWQGPAIDTLSFARIALPAKKRYKLEDVCRHLGISLKNAHRAVHDARATAQMLQKLLQMARERGAATLDQLNTAFSDNAAGDSRHVVLLATSQQGITNLNRLVSEAHLNYFYQRPKIPQTLLQKHREGILVGSACEKGELFQAVLAGRDDKTLSQIARFYDYLEIQPIGNNAFLLRDGRVRDEEELRDFNRRIVQLGEKTGIPVVATGDVHFLRPQDATARAILMAGKGFKNADDQPPLYFHTTEEMLEEFNYLGDKKAREVVIDNPRKIADKVGEVRLFPKHPQNLETFQPFWPEAADHIRELALSEARARYGDPLPDIVAARLQKELKSIIDFGFATLYHIAEKLVKQSNADGYLVGSRGSVGSSLVATMCGITEVNPLPPHYRCPACHFTQFDARHEIATSIGVDLPEMDCPVCGTSCLREGYDIPFEVFLGFEGDKVPDIDLNFSGVYQPRAHKYVETLFPAGKVFRAGTIGTLADKTAYGFVNKYLEERHIAATEAEKNRLAQACVGVKRTTGQHPGGIVVLPNDYEIYEFTAVQHPADDTKSSTITTHYDFGSMHDVLVKLDILGHDDPTMINMLEGITGVNARTLPLDDEQVMSLFVSPKALGVTPEQIRCTTGTLGIPELGTAFVRGMLDSTKPKTMEELVRISGLSHGTDVWLGNAADLIASGKATLSECICTRDDIMNALMLRGVEPKMAFTTMESVRKGRGLTPAMEDAMRAAATPEWFIDSCKKIKYMFPKGHAVAYVMMALRIAWFKVYHPVAYYASYYTVRADAFDIGLMGRSAEGLREALDDFDLRGKAMTAAEHDQKLLAEIALEMVQRGIRLLPIDLYRSKAEEFQIIDGGILPPFTAIPGLGISAAQSLCEVRGAAPFLSMEDVKLRAKLSSAVMEKLAEHGALADLPETSQVSLFSL